MNNDILKVFRIETYEDFKRFCQDASSSKHYPAVYGWVVDAVPEEWCLKILEPEVSKLEQAYDFNEDEEETA